jgi:hypothetical protein
MLLVLLELEPELELMEQQEELFLQRLLLLAFRQ